tara:strand:- start:350 stop:583 length:234 start_codon:yes stop_codon:yes gene_type:complete
MINFPAPEPYTYRPQSNLIGSYSIKKKDETDFQELKLFLAYTRTTPGAYLVDAYRELDKVSFSKKLIKPFQFQSQTK